MEESYTNLTQRTNEEHKIICNGAIYLIKGDVTASNVVLVNFKRIIVKFDS